MYSSGLKENGKEKEISVSSSHHRLHYRWYRSVVFNMTETTLKNIYSYLIIYQILSVISNILYCADSYIVM